MKIALVILLIVGIAAASLAWRRHRRQTAWLEEQRSSVIAYLGQEGVHHGGVSERPAWFDAPRFALWPVSSPATPHTVGWWAISGDVPTDFVSSAEAHDPRAALAHFVRQWREVSAAMLRGEEHPTMSIGTPADWPQLGALLQSRSELLESLLPQAPTTRQTQLAPPTAEQVARRALVLAAVSYRAALERNAGDEEAKSLQRQLLEWLDSAGSSAAAEPQELAQLKAPLGKLAPKEERDAGWRAEGLGVLAWALGLWELKPFDVQTDGADVAREIGFLNQKGIDLPKMAKLRDLSQLRALARQSYLLHRKLRQAYEGSGQETLSQMALDLKVDLAGLQRVDGDLAIDGKPISSVPKETLRIAISSVVERQRAANWLLGDDARYSEVSYSLRGME